MVESLLVRQIYSLRRGGRVAEGGGLLNRYTGNTVSEVRILSSPPLLSNFLI
jgi:hypothetical protein